MFSEFKDITGFDVKRFIQDSSTFLLSKSQILRSYYDGNNVNPEVFLTELDLLVERYCDFSRIVSLNGRIFNNSQFWELLEVTEDLGTKLLMLTQYSRFLRSSRTSSIGGDMVTVNNSMGQNESIEKLAEQYNSDPLQTFIDNDLNEEKYTNEGGNLLKFRFNRYKSIRVQSIIDNPIGNRVYGKDINKNFKFSFDDIEILQPEKSVEQSFSILTGLRRGQIPENPDRGVDSKAAIGSNMKTIAYPTIMRQLIDAISTDDSFELVRVESVNIEKDSVFIDISAQTIIGDYITGQVSL